MTFSIHQGKAQESVSKTQCVFAVQIPGASAQHPLRRTQLGTHLVPFAVYDGTVNQASGKIIETDTWGLDSALQGFSPEEFYVHFFDGSGCGYLADIASVESGEIHCKEDLPSFIQADDYFQIFRHQRLSEIFTSDNSYGFGAGESADQSDNIAIFNPDLQTEEIFYFHSVRLRWEKEGVPENANNHLVRFPYGFFVIRRTTGMIKILLRGIVHEAPILLPVQTGLNLFSIPIGNTTSINNLISVSGAHSAQSGLNAVSSDLVFIHESSAIEQRGPFYYSTASNSPKWLKVGDSSNVESSTLVDPLSALIIHRKGSPGFLRVESDQYNPPPYFSLASNPEPGELPTTTLVQFDLPGFIRPDLTYAFDMSSDLANWVELDDEVYSQGNVITFQVGLPPGQSRRFYRLRVNAF